MKLSDPADKALDATADGAFGGKTNRRAGYSKTVTLDGIEYTEIDWIKRTALRDGTLASGEGRKLVEHYEGILVRLRCPSEALTDVVRDTAWQASAAVLMSNGIREILREAVYYAEQEADK